ncbi:MAG: hypothetical protein ACREJC_11430 [Tepidisphaeraceae bacterium]
MLNPRPHSRGFALMLVIGVVALAAVLGLAMLSSVSLQSQVSANSARAAQAQYLAESGINLAMFYLQNPDQAPALSGEFYPGQGGVAVNCAVPATVDTAVERVGQDTYDVTATAHVGSSATNRLSRAVRVRMQVNSTFEVDRAGSFNGNFVVPAGTNFNGDVRADGQLSVTFPSGGVNGAVQATGANVPTWTTPPSFPTTAAPTLPQVNLVKSVTADTPYYTYQDQSGNDQVGRPQLISGTIADEPKPAEDNPKNVWYSTDDVTIRDCTFTGTVVIARPGKVLSIEGQVNIASGSGMPAVVVGGNLALAPASQMTVDGLVYVGGGIAGVAGATPIAPGNGGNGNVIQYGGEAEEAGGAVSEEESATPGALSIHGALMMGGSVPQIEASAVNPVTVTFDASKAQSPNFSDANRTPQGIRIIKWGA